MNYYEHSLYQEEIEEICERNPAIPKLKNKTLAITGARGLIGSMLVDVVQYANRNEELNCHVYGVVRNMEKAKERFSKYESDENFELIQADINKNEIQIDSKIDYFIHGASNTHPILYASRPIETIRTNTIGTDFTLDFAVRHDCKRYLFLSSVEIYGENRGDVEKFSEDYCGYIDCNTLRAGYPESKRVGESLCQAYRKEKGIECIIARIARCYGAGLLTEDSKALSQFLRNAVKNEDIVLKSEGKQLYSYVYVADAVDALLFLLVSGRDGEVYNIAGQESDTTLGNLASLIANESGREVRFDLPEQMEAEGYSKAIKALMDNGKLNMLGWRGNYAMHEGIKHTIKMLKEQGR